MRANAREEKNINARGGFRDFTPAITALVAVFLGACFVAVIGHSHLVGLAGSPIVADVLPVPAYLEAGASLLASAPLAAVIAAVCVVAAAVSLTDGPSAVMSTTEGGAEAGANGLQSVSGEGEGSASRGSSRTSIVARSFGASVIAYLLAYVAVVILAPLGEPPEGAIKVSMPESGGETVEGEIVAFDGGTWIVRPDENPSNTVVVPEGASEVVIKPPGEDR